MRRTIPYLLGIVLSLLGTVVSAAAPGSARDPADLTDLCNDATTHWPTSLYCLSDMDFDGDGVADPAPPPSPPLSVAAPTDPLEDFWYRGLPVWLNGKGDRITCLDGTKPAAWVSKARDGMGTLIDSNRWIFYFQGGGSCSTGDGCADTYLTDAPEQGELTSAHLQVVGRSARYNGLLSSSTLNPFSEYNRVVIHKCGFDRFNGYVVDPTAHSTALGVDYDRRQMGYNITNAYLEQLQAGWSYAAWDEGLVDMVAVSLPPLEDAEVILFFGTSGGAHGLHHNVDRFKDRLQGWPGFTGRVAAIFDSNFMPSLDGEDGNVYSGARSGITGAFAWDDHIYQPAGAYHDIMAAWEAVADESCRSVHGGVDGYTCMDRHHVLANHIETDFFVLQDHWDPNPGHCNGGAGYAPDFADGSGLMHACGVTFDPLAANEFGDLVDGQAEDIAFSYASSEIALGIDPSPQPTRYFVGLQCNRHEHLIASNALSTTLQHAVDPNESLQTLLIDWVDNQLGMASSAAYNPLNGWSMVPLSGACP